MSKELSLKENGCEIWNNYLSKKTVDNIIEKANYFFDKNLNLGAAVNVGSLKENELTTYGAARKEVEQNNKNFYLKEQDFNKGVEFYRNLTNGISIKEPLLNINKISQIVSDENILNLVREYLNEKKVYIGFIKLRRFFCNNLPDFDTNYFHFDDNSDKILKCIIYLNDIITADDGSFVYVKNSHINPMPSKQEYIGKYARTDDQIIEFYGKDSIVKVLGGKGTILFADTLGYHKGIKPKNRDRYILYVNYVLEEEYGGRGLKQKAPIHLMKNSNNKELFKFFSIVDN